MWLTFSLAAEDRSNWFALTPFRTELPSVAGGITDRVESTALKAPFGLHMAVLELNEDVGGDSVFQNGLALVSGGELLSAGCHDRNNALIWLLWSLRWDLLRFGYQQNHTILTEAGRILVFSCLWCRY
jgi:hypothetical protein